LNQTSKLVVILDDRAARSFAEVMGITFLGTAGMLFHAFVKKYLTLAELENAVEALSQTIWLSPAVVADILKKRDNRCSTDSLDLSPAQTFVPILRNPMHIGGDQLKLQAGTARI